MAKRRRRIKEDKLLTTTDKLYIYLSKHWQKIIGVVAVAIILIAAVAVYFSYVTNKNEKAALKLIDAMTSFTEAEAALVNDGKVDSTLEKYEKAKAEFQKSINGGGRGQTRCEALFYFAKCSYQLGSYDDAISAFDKVLRKYPKNILAFYAQAGKGQCYEQLGDDSDLRKAIQQYDELSRAPESYAAMRAFIDEGRCYEKLGEWDEAIKSYNGIVEKFNAKLESVIQTRSKNLVQSAKEVIAKFKAVLGQSQLSADFTKFEKEAIAYGGNQQWFEALKMYDEAIFSQKAVWNEGNVSGENGQDALNALQSYEDSSTNVIKYFLLGRRYEKQGNKEEALNNYRRAILLDFLPGVELYNEAQLRIDWINAVGRNQPVASDQQ